MNLRNYVHSWACACLSFKLSSSGKTHAGFQESRIFYNMRNKLSVNMLIQQHEFIQFHYITLDFVLSLKRIRKIPLNAMRKIPLVY